jgi:hypothetical protein
MIYPLPEHFPGTLYDGDGKRLAGSGPDFSPVSTGGSQVAAAGADRGGETRAILSNLVQTGVEGPSVRKRTVRNENTGGISALPV